MSRSGRGGPGGPHRSGSKKDGSEKGHSGRGRKPAARLKTAKGRTVSSTLWLQRQLSDPYVAEARALGYRSRAAFKLAQMDDRFGFLKRGARVVDLGAAPGGWCQVVIERCGKQARVIAVDLIDMEPLPGVTCLIGDFHEAATLARIKAALDGPADVVLTDMAAPASGHAGTDHLRIMALAEAAFDFAEETLAPGGAFVVKLLQGGAEAGLLRRLKRAFVKLRHVKPSASRAESAELYLVATGFRGGAREALEAGD
ncbi:MAG: RlmE family RNA methyltransferase [Alphaproteobacteria bacterium]